MSVQTIIFSKDRPAQLDLCLRSVRAHLRDLSHPLVLHTSSTTSFADGYAVCRDEHPEAAFVEEHDFRDQVLLFLDASLSPFATFLCDDNVAYRPMALTNARGMLRLFPTILCFSLRLGINTTRCYPLDKEQALPAGLPSGQTPRWHWRDAEGDFGYPGSLDGHIFRRDELLTLIQTGVGWGSPNQLEDCLATACKSALLPEMASYDRSVVVGVPVNSVQETHQTNRNGESHYYSPNALNDRYLAGGRLSLETVVADEVDAAHTEFALRWME